MGFTNDELSTKIIPLGDMHFVTGTWTITVASNIWSNNKTATAENPTVHIPICAPLQNTDNLHQRGCLITSIDLFYYVGTANLTSLAATIYRLQLPADQTALPAVSTPAFTYDTYNNTAANRAAFDASKIHKVVLTLTTPIWLGDGDILDVEVAIQAAATSVIKWYDAQVHFTLRE